MKLYITRMKVAKRNSSNKGTDNHLKLVFFESSYEKKFVLYGRTFKNHSVTYFITVLLALLLRYFNLFTKCKLITSDNHA